MKFRLILLLGLASFFAAGCATHQKAPGATFDRIGQEMQGALDTKAKAGADAALNQAMLPPLQLELPESAKSVEPHFDLAVSNAPASQVFMALVSGTRYSMLVAPEVSGTVTVNLKSVTVREALETLRELYGYEFKVQGTRIYIQPNTMQTRMFQVNYLAGKRQGLSDIRVSSGSLMMQTSNSESSSGSTGASTNGTSTSVTVQPSAQISTSQDADFWSDLVKALASIVGTLDGRSVIVNPGSGVVLIKAFPADIRAVENYLKMTQLIVERQVMLEAKILEVSLSEEFQAGVNWASFGAGGRNSRYGIGSINPGTTLNTSGSGSITSDDVDVTPGSGGSVIASSLGKGLFGLALQTANFAALLNFLETQGNVQVLSSPRIATINNQKAVLKVGTDDFYVTGVTSSSTTTSSNGSTTPSSPTINLQPFFSGIALDVTPQIDGENNVVLHVHPSISTVTEKQKIVNLGSQFGTYTLPLASSTVNETDSIVRVQDGNIVAIGGLMKQEQSSEGSGLPGASKAAGVGWLFGNKSSHLTKRELVILIKSTIIRNESSWKDDLFETQSRVQQLDPRLGQPARP